MSKREDYEKTTEESLALWGARLAAIKAKVDAEPKTDGNLIDRQKLEELQTRGETVSTLLATLRATEGDAWDVLKPDVDKAWHELDSTMNQAEQAMRLHDDAANAAPAATSSPEAPAPASASSPVTPTTVSPSTEPSP